MLYLNGGGEILALTLDVISCFIEHPAGTWISADCTE
jgi:hypothetical protein